MTSGGSRSSRDVERDRLAVALREAGFRDHEGVAASWSQIRRQLPPDSPFLTHWAETWKDIRDGADPELAFSLWIRWVEDELANPPASPAESRAAAWNDWREFRLGFTRISSLSPALGNLLLTLWPEFRPQVWQSGWVTRAALGRRLAPAVQSLGDREFMEFVRRFQRVESLRIAYLDCVQDMPVNQVTLQISTLADALISACYERAVAVVSRRQGKAPPPGGLVVLALGKLGGMELNYSSDVDLNFVYDETVPFLETVDGRRIEDPLEVERFYTLVGERLVNLITSFDQLGQLYRLDTRLRPGGASGRLVWSVRASVDYYYSMGRAWERQALLRMRPVAGDFALAGRMLRELGAFIFPASFSAKEIAEIRGLKLQVEKIATDRGISESQIKIGRGGIRDVEYIVQYLQLIHAAKVPALKDPNVFQALEVLDQAGILKPEETDVLRRGYRFLRRVEHRIQMAHLRQTHQLPDDPRELQRLARGLGFRDAEAFRAHLSQHALAIRRVYELLFEEATAPRDETQELPTLLDLPSEVSSKEGARVLAPFGFRDPDRAFQRLRALSNEGEERVSLDASRSKEVFAKLVAKLLREVSLQPEPDRTLANFEDCVRSLGARSVFYQLLDEDAKILQLFVEICARSSLVVETLRAHPDVFDEVVDCLLTGYEFSRDSLVELIDGIVGGPGFERDIFKFKYLHLLLIAIRDLERMDNLSNTLDRISGLAEAVLLAALRRCLRDAEARMGPWVGAQPRFLLLALGKLGGREMSYKSDLDLVIISSGDATTREGTGTQEYFEKLAQSLLQTCALADSLGPLLRVDLRLRPLGSHNSLAISVDAWKQYFRGGNARTWERQAFLRARPVAGDEGLAREALEFIRGELVLRGSAGPASEEAALSDVWEMRRKIEAHAKPGDVKRGEGGILDVEFLVQALQLVHGKAHPEILCQNTATAIQTLLRTGLLDASAGSDLLTSYQFLRWIENRLSLVGEAGQALDGMSQPELESLVQKVGYKSSGEESALSIFRSELEYHRKKNRQHLLRVLCRT